MADDVQFNLRIPAILKDRVKDAAKESGRSINGEAQYRLEQSFENHNNKDQEIELLKEMNQDRSKDIQKLLDMVEQLLAEKKAP